MAVPLPAALERVLKTSAILTGLQLRDAIMVFYSVIPRSNIPFISFKHCSRIFHSKWKIKEVNECLVTYS